MMSDREMDSRWRKNWICLSYFYFYIPRTAHSDLVSTRLNVFLLEEAALKDSKCEKYEIRDIFAHHPKTMILMDHLN